jgi:glycosyltransferase involved in cell wall biosynthesis
MPAALPAIRRPLRVALVTDTYLPEVNGVTTVLNTMRTGLGARGHEVLVVAPRYGSDGPDDEGVVRLASVPCPGYAAVRLTLPVTGRTSRALRRFVPDLVHVATEGPLGFTARGWAVGRHVPLVTSFHTDFPRYAARYLGPWAEPPVRRYCAWFHGPAAVTQTPSEETAAELRAGGIGPVMVWGRGVDAARFSPLRRSEHRRIARGAADREIVLHVGRLALEKDVAVLIETFRRAHAHQGHRALFIVAGDGPEAAAVRDALPFAVHQGFLDRDELAGLYADSDLFVFPSATETCGLVALEAMASGVPVIAADRGGVLENVFDGRNGRLVGAGDAAAFAAATEQLLLDPALRRTLAAGARAWAEQRSWEFELDALEAEYALVAGPGPRRPRRDPWPLPVI